MKPYLQIARYFLLGAFGLIGLGLIYWQLVRADNLLNRDDNPRLVIAEQRIKRGKILTPNGVALAETITGPDGLTGRRYPYPNLAAVTGYYSIRYGAGGLEAAFDDRLRGESRQSRLDALMHRPPVGQNITVTIQLPAQVVADTALAEANATGAVVVLNAQSGELLVMASRPTFDPNTLDEQWESLADDSAAPLLNRSTQGIFPLGEMVRIVGLIGLFEAGTTTPLDPFETPLAEMLAPLSGQGLAATARQLHFDRELPFSLPTAAGFIPDDLPDKAQEIAATPLHLALMGAAVVREGLSPAPVLAQIDVPGPTQTMRLFGPDTAAQTTARLTEFSALASPQVTGSEPLSWYLGLTEAESPLVIVVVVTTPKSDRQAAKRIAKTTLGALRNGN
jgi:cell division protein FtsI/penicillin-binding protein 2